MKSTVFKAMIVEEASQKTFTRKISEKSTDELPDGDVLVNVLYSSLNYKDALSASGNKGVTRKYPHTPGIDSQHCPMHIRKKIWEKLAVDWKLKNLNHLVSEVDLAGLDERIEAMLQGRSKGRTLVKL